MGRNKIDISPDDLLDIALSGYNQKEAAEILNVSAPTLSQRMAQLQSEQGILLKYRVLQSLQLTALQARILENITPEKIQEASLRDLIMAFKVLKDKELVIEGKPSEIKGLVGYLVEMEKKEFTMTHKIEIPGNGDGDEFGEDELEDIVDIDLIIPQAPKELEILEEIGELGMEEIEVEKEPGDILDPTFTPDL